MRDSGDATDGQGQSDVEDPVLVVQSRMDEETPPSLQVDTRQQRLVVETENENHGPTTTPTSIMESPLHVTPSGRWHLRKCGDEYVDETQEQHDDCEKMASFWSTETPRSNQRNNEGSAVSPHPLVDDDDDEEEDEIMVDGEADALALLTAQLNNSVQSIQSNASGLSNASRTSGLLTKPDGTPFQLYDDIYGLIYLAKSTHPAFYFALFIFTIQALLLVLIFFDMVQVGLFESVDNALNGQTNRINIPAAVPVTVTIAQILGILLTILMVASEGDLTRGCSKLFDGYQKDLIQKDPDATYTTWLIAAIAQVFVGIVMTADCFILIMQSRTVIELCLNFAALHFVQEIDDTAFAVAQRGYISQAIQEECERVAEDMTSTQPWLRTINLRRTLLILITIGLYVPFFVLVSRQWSGYYLCGRLYVQFGDSVEPDLEYYSGIFQSQGFAPEQWLDFRTVYYDQSGTLQLSYCSSEKAWVFSKITRTPCANFFIQSSRTETFDVLEISGEGWSHHSSTGEVSPIDWLSLSCNECGEKKHNDQACNPKYGQCIDHKCECYEGRMGANCEYAEPTCQHLYLDFESRGSLASVPGAFVFFENQYVPLNHTNQSLLQINHRPIYVPDGFRSAHNFAFIIFSGRRWNLFGKNHEEHSSLSSLDLVHQIQQFAAQSQSTEALQNISHLEPYKPLFFSSPVNHGTESDSVEPTNVDWVIGQQDNALSIIKYHANDQKPVSARLLCAECNNDTNPCLNAGTCKDGVCVCPPSYHGPLCESAYTCQEKGCVYGGECDPILNTCINCREGFFGTLCQYYQDQEVDPFFCHNTTCKNGRICNPFKQRCECKEGFGGELCDLLVGLLPGDP